MGYRVVEAATGKVLEKEAICTPFLISEGFKTPQPAVKREGAWYVASYPGFELEPTERPVMVLIKGG